MNKEKSVYISTATQKRLLMDIKDLIRNPLDDNGIFYKHDESDMLKGYALIIGPENSVYEYGNYIFEFTFPQDYPLKPPIVSFKTNDGKTRFHPNLYRNGKVCLSILNTWRGEEWTSCLTIKSILLSIVSILDDKPLLHEPGITENHTDFLNYNKIIEYKNMQFSYYYILKNKDTYLNNKFVFFHEIIKENFIKNYEKINQKLERLKSEQEKTKDDIKNICYSIRIYGDYNTNVNYNSIQKNIRLLFKEYKKELDNKEEELLIKEYNENFYKKCDDITKTNDDIIKTNDDIIKTIKL